MKKWTSGEKMVEIVKSYILKPLQQKGESLLFLTRYSHHFPQGSLELLVPQAVDEGLQGWKQQRVQD